MADDRKHSKTDDEGAREAFEKPLEEAAKGSWEVPGRNWPAAIIAAAVLIVAVLLFAWWLL